MGHDAALRKVGWQMLFETPGKLCACLAALVLGLGLVGCGSGAEEGAAEAPSGSVGVAGDVGEVPIYEWDPTWPKQPLPDNWAVGAVVGVSVDAMDHIWVVHRPRGAVPGTQARCCVPAPAVIEFDQQGNVVQAWGGPRAEDLLPADAPDGPLPTITWTPPTDYEWVSSEHNIFVDHEDHVWLGNYSGSHILKFNRAGELLLQIGRAKATGQDTNTTDAFGSPTGITVDPAANEVYVADGYGNHRVIVFDAETGAYKRHWGAYGNTPDDSVSFTYTPGGPPLQQFNIVHCVQIDQDDLVWVCDRGNYRIQVFQKDGTFVKEVSIAPAPDEASMVRMRLNDGRGGMRPTQIGTVFDLVFSRDPDQSFVFVADGLNEKVLILRRSDMEIVGSIGHAGHWGGGFTMAHNLGVDSANNLYVSESSTGRRVQRFLYRGMGPASGDN